jgi:hypothetical protein
MNDYVTAAEKVVANSIIVCYNYRIRCGNKNIRLSEREVIL